MPKTGDQIVDHETNLESNDLAVENLGNLKKLEGKVLVHYHIVGFRSGKRITGMRGLRFANRHVCLRLRHPCGCR
jgi:hypothetical protein